MDGKLIDHLWPIYLEAFRPLEVASPLRQSMTEAEFRSEMAEPTVLKYLAMDSDVRALLCITSNFDRVPWLSRPYYAQRFPDEFADGRVFVVGSLLTSSIPGSARYLLSVLTVAIGDVFEQRGVVVFDCCRHNAEVTGLPRALASAGRRVSKEIRVVELDYQKFYAGGIGLHV